jgi:hypothetical protein
MLRARPRPTVQTTCAQNRTDSPICFFEGIQAQLQGVTLGESRKGLATLMVAATAHRYDLRHTEGLLAHKRGNDLAGMICRTLGLLLSKIELGIYVRTSFGPSQPWRRAAEHQFLTRMVDCRISDQDYCRKLCAD